jgi:hypothetical protein
MENVKTAAGANLNNDLIEQVLTATEQVEEKPVILTSPSDNLVDLPAGFINSAGEVAKTAEVRELNGRDEEAIGKAGGGAKAYAAILSRATVSIGGEPANDKMLNSLLLGDRDALMLGIWKATFGNEAELPGFCASCNEVKFVAIDVTRDVDVKILVDPIEDRTFTVKGRKKEFLVTLPTGVIQKDMADAADKTAAERNTILLQNTVLEIDGQPVIGKAQVQELGVADRNVIAAELSKRLPGPQFEDIVIDCTDCEEGKVVVPFNLGALFRL